jgi:hypothetical protein
MAVSIEFMATVLDTVSFFLVTPDLVGKRRIEHTGHRMGMATAKALHAIKDAINYLRRRPKLSIAILVGAMLFLPMAFLADIANVGPSGPVLERICLLSALITYPAGDRFSRCYRRIPLTESFW